MEKISWIERKSNEEALIMVDERRSTKAKERWIGHIVCGNGLLKEVIEIKLMDEDIKEEKGLKC